jgi:NADH pyrophosphatase NudC (nudix superfamily)
MKPSADKKIRPIVICVFKHEGKILVCEGYDKVKNEIYYRPLGGGIEFQESAVDALKREVQEELGTEINNERYLGTFENIFVLEGNPKHEIMLVYDAKFIDNSVYQNEYMEIKESGWERAVWKSLDEFAPGNLILYPEGLKELILRS